MKSSLKKHVNTVFGVLVGNAILAFTVVAFIVPHGVIMGGATGIGLTIAHYVPVDLSIIIFIVNSILFLSIVQKIPGIDGLTDNLMLATLYAGALLGVGIGLIVRVGSSTGGTDIVALVLNKWFHIPVAGLLYVIDFLVLGGQVFFSDTEQIMYGVLMLVLETAILNKVMLLGQSQIQLFIISEEYEHIREKMLKELDAGVTMVHVETGYGQENQKGVLCIIPNRKLYSVKELVQSIDPKAFITITQINEVRGRGFSMERVGYEEIPQDAK